MNKQSLYLFGGALLATSALSSTSQAGTVKAFATSGLVTTSGITAKSLATEVFSATAATANAAVIGSGGGGSSNLMIDFASTFTTPFNVNVFVTGASLTGTPTVTLWSQSTAGTLSVSTASACTVQSLPDKLLLTGCMSGATAQTSVGAINITGITYNNANALATAGTSIKIDGYATNSAGVLTYETIDSRAVVTSKSAIESAIELGATVSIDSTVTPVFSKFVTSGATATLGSIHFSLTTAKGADLSNAFSTAASATGAVEVKVAHAALSDLPGLLSVSVVNTSTISKSPGAFVSGTVSFQVPANSLDHASIQVTFDGTTAIASTSGTATATVTPITGPTEIVRAVAAFSGNLANYSRGGLSTELNTVLGISGYNSILRVANTSSLDGVATITVKNDTTGAAIGSFEKAVKAGAGTQVSTTDIEVALPTAKATGGIYKVTVSGAFTGYVQHLLQNPNGTITDLSGFRNGVATIDP